MRAFTVPEFNGTGSVTEVPIPASGEGQILVRVRAAGVNPIDPFAVSGAMKEMVPHTLPFVPGFDYAGDIEAVGRGVETVRVGDEVYGPVGKMVFGEGSWAEYVTVNAALANPTPSGLDPNLAAALPTAGGEAIALVDAADAREGSVILVVGAAGGVGSYAVQLATHMGARVIAATRPASTDYVRSLGAVDVVDSEGDVVAQVRRRYPDGVDAIIDNYHDVAGLRALAPLIRRGGWIVTPKARGVEDAFADELFGAALVSANFGRLGELGELVARGEITITTQNVPLEEAGGALQAIASASVRGKMVITVS